MPGSPNLPGRKTPRQRVSGDGLSNERERAPEHEWCGYSLNVEGGVALMSALSSLVFALCLLSGPAQGADADGALKRKVLAEYPAALRELSSRFARASGSVKYTTENRLKAGSEPEQLLVTFASRRPAMWKIQTERLTPAPRAGNTGVRCFNESYYFTLAKERQAREYRITSVDTRENLSLRQRGAWGRFLDAYVDAPLRMDRLRLTEAFADPNFSVRSVSPVAGQQKGMLRIAFDWGLPALKSAGGGFEGWLLVSPEQKWVVREYEFRSKNGVGVHKGVLEYGDVQDGFPVPKRFTKSTFSVPRNLSTMVETYDFQEFRFVDLPAEDFTLAAFGFPESALRPGKVARTNNAPYWFFGAAFMALAVCVALRWASSRLRRAPSAAS
jgi:hypothetical protein